jgi:hypothetical protein
MTSRRSPPRRSSGSDRAAIALLAVVAIGSAAGAARADHAAGPLKETRAGAEIDWAAGTIAASGGAAADLRMPSVDLARPGAQRRAQAAAAAKLRATLADLPLGAGKKLTAPEINRAIGRARAVDVQYQSNGGAIARLELRFGDWLEAPSPEICLAVAVPSIRLGAAPTVRIAGRDVRVGAAHYVIKDANVVKNVADARVDKEGRLVAEGDAKMADKLARCAVMIYVAKVQR